MVLRHLSSVKPWWTSHHLPMCRMYAKLKRRLPAYSRRAKGASKVGLMAVGPRLR